MSHSTWTTSGRVKIDRANELIGDLVPEVVAFLKSNTEVVGEDESCGDRIFRFVTKGQLPPLRFGAIAGDIVHNLRSSLDLLWRQVNTPGLSADTRSEEFPIRRGVSAFARRVAKAKPGREKAAMDLLQQIKGNERGNHNLLLLEELNDAEKHRILLPVYGAVTVTSRKESPTPGVPIFRSKIQIYGDYPLKDGAIVHRIGRAERGKVDMDPEFDPRITFGDPPSARGEFLLETLTSLVGTVEHISAGFLTAGLLT